MTKDVLHTPGTAYDMGGRGLNGLRPPVVFRAAWRIGVR